MIEPLHDPPDHDGPHAVFCISGSSILVVDEGDRVRPLRLHEAIELTGIEPDLVVARHGDTLYWAAELPAGVDPGDRHVLSGLRPLHGRLSDLEWNLGGRATQLLAWQLDNRYCGRCGGPMRRSPGERAMRCPVDGNLAYPRLSPAVIVLVHDDDDRVLLARNGRFDIPMFSTLAGFVEPGESLEDTVRREILEEVGVAVDDIRYFGSQPWPFPNSLMLGFHARYAGGEIRPDGIEIVEAAFFGREELPMIPPGLSIARQLIDDWVLQT